ncbi:MAG: SAM-dependent chlorinase/fluorinase [Thermodesulfovibrionales bacterium]|nr:SAM-dependent chlorinase/fluorinase [Thermodesulfovibrionales bacterium]
MVITLLTDFGIKDTFVAEMKGVILSINPSATVVDITHEIEPFNITEAAIKLATAVRYFPRGTVHLAIVDPGVGSQRGPIIIKTERACFVGPDNGVLSLAVKEDLTKDIYEITLPVRGYTFHGRDLFAPVAARLSKGEPPELVGRKIDGFTSLSFPEPAVARKKIKGEVIVIDRFGNAITNINSSILGDRRFRVRIKKKEIPVFRFYMEAGNRVGALINSSGYLEIFKYRSSAQKALDIKLRDKVEVLIE